MSTHTTLLASFLLSSFAYGAAQTTTDLTLTTRWLSSHEFTKYNQSINPINKLRVQSQYKALEIVVTNTSLDDYLLFNSGINVPAENPEKIKHKLTTSISSFPLIAGIGMGTLLIATIGLAIVPSVAAGVVVGLTALSIDVNSSNKKMAKKIFNDGVNIVHPVVIEKCNTTKKIIFIRKKYTQKIPAITLKNRRTQKEVTFKPK